MEIKEKHIEFIQNVITRMNSNSFMIKGWAITICSAILAVFVSANNSSYLIIGILPISLFWLLDAYYLKQERLFRCLYNKVINLDPSITAYEMKIPKSCKIEKHNSYCRTFFSHTIWPLYFTLTLISLGSYLYIKTENRPIENQKRNQVEMADTVKTHSIGK